MKPKYWWIKERLNPQLGVYYVACGQMPVVRAKAFERPGYGENIMHRFSSEKSYECKLAQLRQEGHRVQ